MTSEAHADNVEYPTGDALQIALWGPSSAGKTVFLSQLYNEAATSGDWGVYPTEESQTFVRQMREQMVGRNSFPPATAFGSVEHLRYRLRHHRSGREVELRLEDRAGSDYEEIKEDVRERLIAAAGLVLLFDPGRSIEMLESEVWRTLEDLHVAARRGARRDERPIAVCLSKADLLIESPADLERALTQSDAFVRDRVGQRVVRALERFCHRYRLFPISATGARIVHGVVERVVFYDERRQPRVCPEGSAPFNLMAPFAWVLQESLPALAGDGP